MNAFAQGSAGIALVMAFALLPLRQLTAASILLAVQSVAVAAVVAIAGHPLLAVPPVLLAGLVWRMRTVTAAPLITEPVRSVKLAVVGAVVLAVLCQSSSVPGVPLALFLLSMLLATIQENPLMRLVALVGMQNGIALAGCLMLTPPLLPLACLLLPLPFAASLAMKRRVLPRPPWIRWAWTRWIPLALAVSMFAVTLTAPLDAYASVFAPLITLAGVLRFWSTRTRRASVRQVALVLQLGFTVLAICATAPVTAWLAMAAAVFAALSPLLARRRDTAVLALSGAGLALFGLLTLPLSLVGYFSLFVGYAMIAACVPALGAPLVILLLRQTSLIALPDAVATLLLCLAVSTLLACSILLIISAGKNPRRWLHATQLAFAVLPLGLERADSRFATLVLLVLLILANAAVPAVACADVVLFPGLALVILDIARHEPWLLAALAIGTAPMLLAFGVPKALPPPGTMLPLVLALLFGFLTPESLVHWLQALTALRP